MFDFIRIDNINIISLLTLPVLYAETHYRFKYFFSYLKKNEPEIIADIPSRLKKGQKLPLLIIVKDADKYPVELKLIEIYENTKKLFSREVNTKISDPYKDIINYFDSNVFLVGEHSLGIKISYRVNGKDKICFADNHRGTSHRGLPIYISSDSLPCFDNCILGETHSHTNYTSDQVEFGASLSATAILAKALGLNFYCATDHSYDLDDDENNYLTNDPELKKWVAFRKEIKKINLEDDNTLIIPGEEVTVHTAKEKNVHILVYNSEKYFPGSGDSGEKWFRNRSELSIPELISKITDSSAVFAAHPAETPPFLQRIFINRGIWRSEDCRVEGIDGLQFINGGEDEFNTLGKNLWINQLLKGYRLIGIAGNDAHGNFARFRQVGFPFFTMRENYLHLFGKWWTGVYMDPIEKDADQVILMIKKGNCYLTNGPAIQMQVFSEGKWYPMGSNCSNPEKLKLEFLSTEEFSEIKEIVLIAGNIENMVETEYFNDILTGAVYDYKKEIILKSLPVKGYLRSEVITASAHQAFSNPIWF